MTTIDSSRRQTELDIARDNQHDGVATRVFLQPIAAPSIVGAAGCWVGVCWARGRSGETLAAIARPSNNKIALLPVIASLCNCGSGWGSGGADIAHRIEIRFAQLRRQRSHIESVAACLAIVGYSAATLLTLTLPPPLLESTLES